MPKIAELVQVGFTPKQAQLICDNADISGMVPIGVILPYGGTAAPTNYLLCDGTAVSRTTYADLFTAIGTAFGVGDGSTTFNLPDLRQRFPLGKAASGTGSTLGGTGGNVDHTHSVPAHYHGMGTGADLNITSSGNHKHYLNVSNSAGGALKAVPYNANYQGDTVEELGTVDTGDNDGKHIHGASAVSGRVGLVTGGVDGNAAMTSGTGNPPFQAVNYIIRY